MPCACSFIGRCVFFGMTCKLGTFSLFSWYIWMLSFFFFLHGINSFFTYLAKFLFFFNLTYIWVFNFYFRQIFKGKSFTQLIFRNVLYPLNIMHVYIRKIIQLFNDNNKRNYINFIIYISNIWRTFYHSVAFTNSLKCSSLNNFLNHHKKFTDIFKTCCSIQWLTQQ